MTDIQTIVWEWTNPDSLKPEFKTFPQGVKPFGAQSLVRRSEAEALIIMAENQREDFKARLSDSLKRTKELEHSLDRAKGERDRAVYSLITRSRNKYPAFWSQVLVMVIICGAVILSTAEVVNLVIDDKPCARLESK